jgi:uncharacterized Fe-S cluster protein YjdI
MDEDIHQYSGEQIEVSYDILRCTHARECVEKLPEVFDPDERPWIDPDNADVDDLAGVIMQCPTGALQFERSDGGPSEPVPGENTITVVPDGPLYLGKTSRLRIWAERQFSRRRTSSPWTAKSKIRTGC